MSKKMGMLDKIMSKKNNEIIIVDIETTGLSSSRNHIIEIGICLLDLETGFCKKIFDQVVREHGITEQDNNAWIFQNSDLKFDEVLNAPLLDEFFLELQAIFNQYRATAYNKQFDFGFLKLRGFKIERELPCPMIESTPILKLDHRNGNASSFYNGSPYKYPSVEEAWQYYIPEIPYIELHRAYDDAVHEARIVYEMYKRNQINISE